MLVPIGISNRHVHLTKEDFKVLFGDKEMTLKASLKQPGNFACEEVVTIKTEKGLIEKVRVLGGYRSYTQVELSGTDARILGINPPVRQSGDVLGGAEAVIVGPVGSINTTGCIIPQRHIHILPEDKMHLGLPDVVSLVVPGEKGGVIGDVHVRATENSYFEAHLDTDEANAFRLNNNQELEIKF